MTVSHFNKLLFVVFFSLFYYLNKNLFLFPSRDTLLLCSFGNSLLNLFSSYPTVHPHKGMCICVFNHQYMRSNIYPYFLNFYKQPRPPPFPSYDLINKHIFIYSDPNSCQWHFVVIHDIWNKEKVGRTASRTGGQWTSTGA